MVRLTRRPVDAAIGVVTVNWETGAGLTLIGAPPEIEGVTVSVAVNCTPPAVLNVAEKVPVPLASFESAGNAAWLSLLIKCTVPE